jgi:ATP-dependent Clp protease protease subunit
MQILKTLITTIIAIASISCYSGTKKDETILLTPENSYTIRTEISNDSVNEAISNLTKINEKLEKGKPIYLVLDSPGGSITAGMKFIQFAKGLDREVKTISIFSASMAYQIVQALGERLSLPMGVLMAHPGSTRCQGKAKDIAACLDVLRQFDAMMHKQASKRIGMDYVKYRKLIQFDKYFIGDNLKRYNVIDRLVSIKCSESLQKQKIEIIERVFIFVSKKVMSGCPLLDKPLGYEPENKKKQKNLSIKELIKRLRKLKRSKWHQI